jgi:hypothetical protein
MRTPIFVRVERFDLESVVPEIEAIRDCFDRYLDNYPIKSARSKTSLMGPVGKVLQGARTGKWDAESLAGYALNIHLSNPKAKGYISQETRQALREGIGRLLELLKTVPVTAQDKVLDRIDYGLYFVRRAKGLEWLEKRRQQLVSFLHQEYETDEAFTAAWGKKWKGIDSIYYFGPNSDTYREGNNRLRADMDACYALLRDLGEIPEVIEEEEEIQ